HVGIMSEKERAAGADADIEFDSEIRVTIGVVIAVGDTAPAAAIVNGNLRLTGPTGVVKLWRDRMRGRSNCEEIDDHCLVETSEAMLDVAGPVGRPMPVESVAVGATAIPIPLDSFPQFCDAGIEIALG